jgi:hypothetical protein
MVDFREVGTGFFLDSLGVLSVFDVVSLSFYKEVIFLDEDMIYLPFQNSLERFT